MLKNKSKIAKSMAFFILIVMTLFIVGCRYDMQDQPRLKSYKQSDFFTNQMGSRPLVEGTVPRGFLREDKALFTGKKDGAATTTTTANAQPTQTTGGIVTQANATYPDAVTEFPFPVTQELINRGEERYRVFCIVCHGPGGNADGMVARRGYQGIKTYHSDELRNAPVGHFYDVITNGWGRMNGYAAQVPVYDRWAIVAYIRTLQTSQNPDLLNQMPVTAPSPAANENAPHGGGH